MTIDQSFFLTTAILFGYFALITIIFSLIVILTIVCNWHPRCRSTANLLACNSCIAVTFYAIAISIQIPFIIRNDPLQSQNTDTRFCKILAFLITVATIGKVYSYLVQAISCFFITMLHRHRFLLSFRMNWIMICTSWIASGVIAGGMFVSPLGYEYEPESHLCVLSTKYFRTSFLAVVVVFCFTTNTIIMLYGIILWRTTRFIRLNPNNAKILQAKRNIKVFKKILIFITILVIGGTPYLLSVILNRIDKAPWPLYSISILFIAFSAAVESIALLFTNEQVKRIFFEKLNCYQNNPPVMQVRRANQVLPRPFINALSANVRF